jgi:hypothetical protein
MIAAPSICSCDAPGRSLVQSKDCVPGAGELPVLGSASEENRAAILIDQDQISRRGIVTEMVAESRKRGWRLVIGSFNGNSMRSSARRSKTSHFAVGHHHAEKPRLPAHQSGKQ